MSILLPNYRGRNSPLFFKEKKMANRTFNDVQALNKFGKIIAGVFEIAAGGAVSGVNIGKGFTVAKSGTGEYTVTLADKYNGLISGQVQVEAAVNVDLVGQITSHDVAAASPNIVISLLAAAVATDPAAVTKVHFFLFLTNSSLDA